MGIRPSFQFYPSDHRKETGLQLVSLAARGLWSDMLCVMHEADPYGHLMTATGQRIEAPQLARLVGESTRVVQRLLEELETNKVFSRNEEGVIFSRRMVRDERNRAVRAAGGARSLENPNVPRPKDIRKDTPKDPPVRRGRTQERIPSPPSSGGSPSSSSSSSSSVEDPLSPPGRGSQTDGSFGPPSDWSPTDEHRAIAAELDLDVVEEAALFRDNAADKGITSRSWDARFRSWLRRAPRFAGTRNGHPNGDGVIEMSDEAAAAWERLG